MAGTAGAGRARSETRRAYRVRQGTRGVRFRLAHGNAGGHRHRRNLRRRGPPRRHPRTAHAARAGGAPHRDRGAPAGIRDLGAVRSCRRPGAARRGGAAPGVGGPAGAVGDRTHRAGQLRLQPARGGVARPRHRPRRPARGAGDPRRAASRTAHHLRRGGRPPRAGRAAQGGVAAEPRARARRRDRRAGTAVAGARAPTLRPHRGTARAGGGPHRRRWAARPADHPAPRRVRRHVHRRAPRRTRRCLRGCARRPPCAAGRGRGHLRRLRPLAARAAGLPSRSPAARVLGTAPPRRRTAAPAHRPAPAGGPLAGGGEHRARPRREPRRGGETLRGLGRGLAVHRAAHRLRRHARPAHRAAPDHRRHAGVRAPGEPVRPHDRLLRQPRARDRRGEDRRHLLQPARQGPRRRARRRRARRLPVHPHGAGAGWLDGVHRVLLPELGRAPVRANPGAGARRRRSPGGRVRADGRRGGTRRGLHADTEVQPRPVRQGHSGRFRREVPAAASAGHRRAWPQAGGAGRAHTRRTRPGEGAAGGSLARLPPRPHGGGPRGRAGRTAPGAGGRRVRGHRGDLRGADRQGQGTRGGSSRPWRTAGPHRGRAAAPLAGSCGGSAGSAGLRSGVRAARPVLPGGTVAAHDHRRGRGPRRHAAGTARRGERSRRSRASAIRCGLDPGRQRGGRGGRPAVRRRLRHLHLRFDRAAEGRASRQQGAGQPAVLDGDRTRPLRARPDSGDHHRVLRHRGAGTLRPAGRRRQCRTRLLRHRPRRPRAAPRRRGGDGDGVAGDPGDVADAGRGRLDRRARPARVLRRRGARPRDGEGAARARGTGVEPLRPHRDHHLVVGRAGQGGRADHTGPSCRQHRIPPPRRRGKAGAGRGSRRAVHRRRRAGQRLPRPSGADRGAFRAQPGRSRGLTPPVPHG
ncbi:hypothetical protein SAXI111661_20025 [Saccharomonospora xinjiangensis]